VPGESASFGGDWYDVFGLPTGGWCVVIGDVVGRGFVAAEAMGRLRSALRAHAMHSADPAVALTRLNQQVLHFEGKGMLATVQVAILEPGLDRLHVSSAGHPPPVLSGPDEQPRLLPVWFDPPVGVPSRPRRTATFNVPPGSVLCFYTDGLVERREDSLQARLHRLRDTVVSGSAETVCRHIMAQLIGANPAADDTAVLVMRRLPARVDAEPTAEVPPEMSHGSMT
jgi:serine phosphatase RsbU (regulator of sigma subunit)